jgi:hypothetical protein
MSIRVDPSTVNWDDKRIAPHLQSLADQTFARLMTLAQEKGIPLAGTLPFDVMDEGIGNTWKACIILFLQELMPEGITAQSIAPREMKP